MVTTPARLPLTGTPIADVGRRSAALAVWGTEYVRGRIPLEKAVRAIVGSDFSHVVDGFEPGGPSGPGSAGIDALLVELRRSAADGLRLVLPAPGDPRGLPGPGAMGDRALLAGEAVRVQGGSRGYGFVPAATEHGNADDGHTVTVRWWAFPGPPASPEPAGTRRQAEHDLTDALRTATSAMSSLDVARLSPEAAAALTQVRHGRPALRMPAGHPGEGLWAQAERLAAIVDLAASDDGAAYDRAGALARREVLRELAAAVRRAKTAAVNARLDAHPD